ncbi:hypothetical protein Tco_1138541 [Tanacetum coccineum]
MEMKNLFLLFGFKRAEIQRLYERHDFKGGEDFMKGLKALQSHFTSLSDDLKDFGGVPTFKRTFFQDMDLLEKHLTKEILHEIDCKIDKTHNNKQEVQFNAFKVEVDFSRHGKPLALRKDNSNLRNTALSKSVKESSLDSETKDVHAIKYKMSKEKERCMTYF